MQGHLQRRGADSWRISVHLGSDASIGRRQYAQRTVSGTKPDAQRFAASVGAATRSSLLLHKDSHCATRVTRGIRDQRQGGNEGHDFFLGNLDRDYEPVASLVQDSGGHRSSKRGPVLIPEVLRDDEVHAPADRLVRLTAKNLFGPAAPEPHNAVLVEHHYGPIVHTPILTYRRCGWRWISGGSALRGEELPGTGNALQLVFATLIELDA